MALSEEPSKHKNSTLLQQHNGNHQPEKEKKEGIIQKAHHKRKIKGIALIRVEINES